jgi:Zn-dependent protease with chaperone function
MGATVYGKVIYISKGLAAQLTPRERKVLLAHELAHYNRKDRLRIMLAIFLITVGILAAFLLGAFVAGWILIGMSGFIVSAFMKHIELSADKYAVEKTKDPQAFTTLMNKLDHGGFTHPTKAERVRIAKEWLDNELN